jgi:hypothetical protein
MTPKPKPIAAMLLAASLGRATPGAAAPQCQRTIQAYAMVDDGAGDRYDFPTVLVTGPDRIVEGFPAVIRVDVIPPAVVHAAPTDPTYAGFNALYPMRLTIDQGSAPVDRAVLNATEANPDAGVHWSARRVGFDVAFTAPAAGQAKFTAHLRYGLCTDNLCTQARATVKWSLPVAARSQGKAAARVVVTSQLGLGSAPEDPGRFWAALVPAARYPADDTCLINDLTLMDGAASFSTRDRKGLEGYAARTGDGAVEFCAPAGDYYLVAGTAGTSWWTNPTIRQRVTVGRRDLTITLTEADRNHDVCGD